MENIELNIEQKKAVETTEGGVLVIAGAGSGKTRVLVERTVNLLINKNVSPDKIIISTFTDRASKELISRISKRIDEYKLSKDINIGELYMGTLHSIFLRLIDEYIDYSNFQEGYRVLEELDQHIFIYSKLKYFKDLIGYNSFFQGDNFQRNSWKRAGKLKYWLNKISESGKTLDYIKDDNDERAIFLKEAYRVYQQLLIEANVIDFASIQREIYRLLSTNEKVLREIQEKIEYIMIDEYQDTNLIQEKIIFLLGGEKKNICVVGDDDQGIYRFRGATVKNILEFPSRFENRCKIITLNINYRSHKDIITFCNRWINLINWREFRYEKKIEPPENKDFSNRAGVVRIGGTSEKIWKENIYRFLDNLKRTKKIEDFSQVAFLFRTTRYSKVKDLADYLEEKGIPVYSPRSKTFFYKKEIKLVIGGLLAVFPQTKSYILDNIYLAKTVGYYKDCLNTLKKERISLNDEELYNWLLEKRKEHIDFGEEKSDNLSEIFYSFFKFKTFKNLINLSEDIVNESAATYNLGLFSHILKDFEYISQLEKFTADNIEKTIKYFFLSHLRFLFEEELNEYEEKSGSPRGAVSFMTIHQAKGLEFPVVIVGSLESEPLNYVESDEENLEKLSGIYNEFEPEDQKDRFDFWRIFYTAFSRAKNLLVLTSIENRARGKELPSRVFRSIFETIPYYNDENFNLSKLDIEDYKGAELKNSFSYTGDILIYETCPLKYKFLKDFNFATLKTDEVSYGLLVHQVIEYLNKEGIKDNNFKIKDIIENISRRLYQNTRALIGEKEKEKAYEDINKYIEFMSDKWENIVSSEEKIYGVEEEYLLEGTVDLILKNGDIIELIDFKTGEFQGYESKEYKSYKRQLEIYTYILRKKYPVDKMKLYLYYTGNEDNSLIEVTKDNLENVKLEFDETIKNILQKRFDKIKFTNDICRKCEFINYCKEEEKE